MTDTKVNAEPLLLTASEAARRLGIGRTTLYELVKAGKIEEVHIGRCARFHRDEVDRFAASLASDRAQPKPSPPIRKRSGRRRTAANQGELFALPSDDAPEAS